MHNAGQENSSFCIIFYLSNEFAKEAAGHIARMKFRPPYGSPYVTWADPEENSQLEGSRPLSSLAAAMNRWGLRD